MKGYKRLDPKCSNALLLLSKLGVTFLYSYAGTGLHPLSVVSFRARHTLQTFRLAAVIEDKGCVETYESTSRLSHYIESPDEVMGDDGKLARALLMDFSEGIKERLHLRVIDELTEKHGLPEAPVQEMREKVAAIDAVFSHIRRAIAESEDPIIKEELKRYSPNQDEWTSWLAPLISEGHGDLSRLLLKDMENSIALQFGHQL